MNKDLAAPRVPSSSLTTATIYALDFTSFTTDLNQTWRSPTPRSTATPQNYPRNSFNQDFQLFATQEIPSASPTASRAQVTSSTLPNRLQQIQSRHLSLNRVSPIHSTQSPSLGHLTHRSYSSPTLQQSHPTPQTLRQIAHLQRLPPVPPFHSTPRKIQPAPAPQGTCTRSPISLQPLTPPSASMSAFDSMYLPGGDLLTSADDFLKFEDDFQATNFAANTSGYIAQDGTVSPADLFHDDSLIMSAPSSVAFPNLSTPESGYLESPATGLNTSPLDDGLLDAQLNFNELDTMPPLFPQDEFDFSTYQAPREVRVKPARPGSGRSSSSASPMVRQKSSPGRPPTIPFSHGRKYSGAYGVSKAPKPRAALPEIHVESEDDKETAKRKKNTAAARKSRQRKQEFAEANESEIQRLRAMIYRMGGDPDEGI